MEYRKFGDRYVVRIDRGEEIIASLTQVCKTEHIVLGSISGIGAADDVTLGVFNIEKFEYESSRFTGVFEIVSCLGSVSTKDGEPYLHLHMAVANTSSGEAHAGHLNRGLISLTGEFIIHSVDGTVEREYSNDVGLNLFKFVDSGAKNEA